MTTTRCAGVLEREPKGAVLFLECGCASTFPLHFPLALCQQHFPLLCGVYGAHELLAAVLEDPDLSTRASGRWVVVGVGYRCVCVGKARRVAPSHLSVQRVNILPFGVELVLPVGG